MKVKKNKVRIWTPADMDEITAEESVAPDWFRNKMNWYIKDRFNGHSARIDYTEDFQGHFLNIFRDFDHVKFVTWIKSWYCFGWNVHIMETRQIGVGKYVILSRPESSKETNLFHKVGQKACFDHKVQIEAGLV